MANNNSAIEAPCIRISNVVPNAGAQGVISLALMAFLVVVVHTLSVPNPNMILVSGLVVCSSLFGFVGGITAGTAMMCYTLYFFSVDNSWLTFEPEGLTKVVVSAIGIATVIFFVCNLRRSQRAAVLQLSKLTDLLREDNKQLSEESVTDALTGIRNRAALVRARESNAHMGIPLTVAMMDVDDFKQVNDTYGHEAGDNVLTTMAQRLAQTFGYEHVYRYGGDEFTVIVPLMDATAFESAYIQTRDAMHATVIADTPLPISISAGYVHGTPSRPDDLRMMLIEADVMLYEAKGSGKGRAMGTSFPAVS